MISTVRGPLAISLSLLLVSALAAQQTPVRDGGQAPRLVGTAALSGIVLNDVTGQPLRRAVVSISEFDTAVRLTAVTDESGTFSFANLPDGRYAVGAIKQGYVAMSAGAKRPQRAGMPIALAAGQRRTGVTLRLPPGAVLSGVVRNRAGEPVPDVRVLILRQTFGFDTGERTLAPAVGSVSGLGQVTDDRGMYRIYGLPADDYFVVVFAGIGVGRGEDLSREITAAEVDWATRSLQASVGLAPAPPPGRAMDYAPVFYPGVSTAAAATMVSVKAGEERSGVDIVFERTPMAKITGTVVSPTGNLPGTLQVNVVAHETISGIPFSGFGNARVEADGRFATGGLAPGDYTVAVRVSAGPAGRGAPPPSASALFGMAVVTVNGADVDTTITMDSGVKVAGRLVFDGTTAKPPADLTRIRITLSAARSKIPTIGVPAANADATGAFVFNGVTPGRYRLAATGAGGWFMRSATLDGRDTLDEPVDVGRVDVSGAEIRLTDVQSEISGDLLDAAGQPAPQYFIIVFSADKAHWVPQSRRIQSVRPANDGKFKVLNLPAGEYYIVAVTDVEQGQWYDPAFLTDLVEASAKITLGDGEKKTQSLRIK